MKRYFLRFALLWLVSVGVGCTSAPVHYYTLTSPAEVSPAPQTAFAIDVRIVHTPPLLHHAELMVRTGPTEMTLLENERWASPVNDEIKDAVRLALQHRLSGTSGFSPTFTKVTLDIDVQHFEAELGRHALFAASWKATVSTGPRSDGARTTTCTFQADEKIRAGYDGMVVGYQQEIAALAQAIAIALTSSANGIDASCH